MHPDAIAELVDPVLGALPELAWRAGLEECASELLEAEAARSLDDLELLAVLRGVGEDEPWGRGVGPP